MTRVERFYFNILCYLILTLFSPLLLIAQCLDSFLRWGVDLWRMHQYIQNDAIPRIEARIARAKLDAAA